MPKFKLKKWVAAGLVLSAPYAATVDAAGLGPLTVLSQLGQPFAAEIDLLNVTREELSTLKATLAPTTAYQAANLTFNPSLNALRITIEKRPDGRPYIKANSYRPVAEPYLDLLIELTWTGGKVTREYSALLDPPGMPMTPPVASTTGAEAVPPSLPAAASAPAPGPTQRPSSSSTILESPPPAPKPAAPAPRASPPRAETRPAAPDASAAAREVAVKSGDTLNAIARSVKPEGVSLDQVLIGIFRANPDAFFGNNINNLRAGKILTIPEREQLAAVAPAAAAQEVRVQAINWNAYRTKVAETAPATVAADTSAATGRITPRVEDKGGPTSPKDVVVLSKGDSGKGAKGGDRVRALEEDLAAKDKALADSKDRIAQLERTLKEAQKLAEMKSAGMASAQGAKDAGKAADKAADKAPPKAEPPKIEPPKAELPKAEPAKDAKGDAKGEAKGDAKDAVKGDAKGPDMPPSPPNSEPPKSEAPKKALPPPEPDMLDMLMDNIVPMGGGLAALLAAAGGLYFLRRRKKPGEAGDSPATAEPAFKPEAFRGKADAAAAAAAAAAATTPAAAEVVSNVSDVVDPLDEAQVYIDHGRDAQAEDILKEAMIKFPRRHDIPVKLLEVYAARGDKPAFNSLAAQVHASTGGDGEDWQRVVAMGYAIDPTNPLYPSDGNDVLDLTQGEHETATSNLDLDIGSAGETRDHLGTTADILLDEGDTHQQPQTDFNRTMVLPRDEPRTVTLGEPSTAGDFNIELPEASPPEPAVHDGNLMDFKIDVPAASAPAAPAASKAPAAPAKSDDGPLDFKVDFGGLSLNLDDQPGAAAAPAAAAATAATAGTHDAHWEDVQQKFDLARAYQEMGDKEGALEILQEVEREGDAGQKVEAQKMIQSLK